MTTVDEWMQIKTSEFVKNVLLQNEKHMSGSPHFLNMNYTYKEKANKNAWQPVATTVKHQLRLDHSFKTLTKTRSLL